MTAKHQNIDDIYSFFDTPVPPALVRLVANQELGFQLFVEFEKGIEIKPIVEGKPVHWRTIEQAIGDLIETDIDHSKLVIDISEWHSHNWPDSRPASVA